MNEKNEEQSVLRRITSIEKRVISLEQTTNFSLRADELKHHETVNKIFGNSKIRAQIYLCVDGIKNVSQISGFLNKIINNVSVELKKLKDEELLYISSNENGIVYSKTSLDKSFRISKYLMNKFQLDKNGFEKKQS